MSDDELEQDEFFEDAMSETERRHDLEREVRVAGSILRDLEQAGPLAGYLKERRRIALGAMTALVGIDPEDAIEIAKAQALVQEYLNVKDWIGEKLTAGSQAKDVLKDEFADQEQDGTTDEQD